MSAPSGAYPHYQRYGLTRLRSDFAKLPPEWHSVCACGYVGPERPSAKYAAEDGLAHETAENDQPEDY